MEEKKDQSALQKEEKVDKREKQKTDVSCRENTMHLM